MFIISQRIQLTHRSQTPALPSNLTCRAFSPVPCIVCTNQYSVTRDCRATSTFWSLPFALALCAAAHETRLVQSCLSSSPLASFPWHLGYLFHVNIPEHIPLPSSAKFAVVLAYQFFTSNIWAISCLLTASRFQITALHNRTVPKFVFCRNTENSLRLWWIWGGRTSFYS